MLSDWMWTAITSVVIWINFFLESSTEEHSVFLKTYQMCIWSFPIPDFRVLPSTYLGICTPSTYFSTCVPTHLECHNPLNDLGQLQKQFLFCHTIAMLRSRCWNVISGNRSFQTWNFQGNVASASNFGYLQTDKRTFQCFIFYCKLNHSAETEFKKADIVTSK